MSEPRVIKPHVRLAKEAKQVPMFLGEIEYNRPLAWLTQQVNANKIMQHPPCRRVSNPLALFGRERSPHGL